MALVVQSIDGIDMVSGLDDAEVRLKDLELARLLEYRDQRDIRELIDANVRELESYGVLPWVTDKSQKQGRPASSYYLNEPQALLVAMFSRTGKAAEVRRTLICTFLKARQAHRRFEYLEARILQFEDRTDWEMLWGPEVVSAICKLYRWPTTGSTGAMYAPLRGVFHGLYSLFLGEDVVAELKARNPNPKRGSNHHQLLQEKVREVVGSDVRLVQIFADQSKNQEEWWAKLRFHFRRVPLQLGFG